MDSSVDDSPDEVYWAVATAEAQPTLREALSGPDGAEWQAAVDYEIGQLEKLNPWKIVDYPLYTNIILCHFILATKRGPDGEKLTLQACLVANGQRQKHRLDYSETFVPTTNMTTIRTILAIATHHNWEIHQMDIKSAYLNVELKDTIYMRALPGYLKVQDEGKVLLLLHSIYSLKQACFEWSEELEKFFLDAGYMCSQVNQAVHFRHITEEHTVITVSVDDMAVTSKHIDCFKVRLHERFKISNLGELIWLLGLKVKHDCTNCTIMLSQKAYVETILEHFNLQDAKPTYIPITAGASLSTDQSPSTHSETQDMEKVPYQHGIGSLMYAATSTHPDIAFPVTILLQFMHNPRHTHWEVVKDVIQYLKGTAEFKLTLGGTSAGLEAYVDADWASQPHRHLMSGYTILLHSSPVTWSARKQSIIALSTTEVEYIALTAITREVLYVQALIAELYEHIISPLPLYCNNQGAIALASNGKFHAHTKHINL
jgi:hypothetical protein